MATSTIDLNALLSSLGSGASGINVSAAVSAAIYAESAPERQWQSQQATLQARQTAINHLNGLASTLSDSLNALSDPLGPMTALTANSSDSSLVTASAVTGTATGNHVVVVNNLASTASWYSDSVSSDSVQLQTGGFTLQASGGPATTIQTGSGVNTLAQLASAINGQDLGVTASVVNDADGSRLALVSRRSGGSGDFSITNATGMGFTQAVKGQNASITLDGIPLSSASNTVSGAVNGLTLDLLSAAPGTEVSMSIAPDSSAIANAINSFVTAYNAIIQNVSSQFAYDMTNQTSGPLATDSVVRGLQGALLGIGAYAAGGSISTLGTMGISMQDDGTLSIDSAALSSALQNSFSAVETFFQGTGSNGFAQSLSHQLNTYTDPSQGAFSLDLQSTRTENTDLQNQMDSFDLFISAEQTRLTNQYSQADILLQQLPNQMKQIDTMLGYNTNNNG